MLQKMPWEEDWGAGGSQTIVTAPPPKPAPQTAAQATIDANRAAATAFDPQEAKLRNDLLAAQIARETAAAKQKAENQDKLGIRVTAARQLLNQLDAQDAIYQRDFTNNDLLGFANEFNPWNPSAQAVRQHSDNMLPFAKQFMRVPGEGAQSDRDASDYRALLPDAWKSDRANEISSDNLRATAMNILKEAGVEYQPQSKAVNQSRPAIGNIKFNDEMPVDPMAGMPRLSQEDQAFIGANARFMTPQSMKAWFAERQMQIPDDNAQAIYDYYVSGGQQNAGVSEGGLERAYAAQLDQRNAGKADPGLADLLVNGATAGSSPMLAGFGGGLGAALSGQGFGKGYDIARDAERRRLDQFRDKAGLKGALAEGVGMVGGSLLAGGAVGAIPKVRAATSPGMTMAIGDTAFGSGYGANNAAPGQEGRGAITGGATALLGNVAGTGAGKAFGSFISPSGGSAARLYESGVRPTIGQRLAGGTGLKGVIGNSVNGIEQALQSIPVAGYAVKGARDRAREQFETGAFNQALAAIGEKLPAGVRSGTEAHNYSQKAFDSAYDRARQALVAQPDAQMSQEFGQLQQQIMGGGLSEASAKRFATIVKENVGRRMQGGTLMGSGYKKAMSALGKISRANRVGGAVDPELADAIDAYRGILDGSARRHSPPDAIAALDAADAGYSQFVRIEDAAARAGGDAGRFSPAQFDRAVQKMAGGVRSKAYLRGDALMEDYAQAGKRLVDTLPDSGTAGRVVTIGAGGGALAGGLVEPTTLAGVSALAAPYLPGVRNVVQGAMAPRGSLQMRKAADILRRQAYIGGGVAAPLALLNFGQQN